jgi:hypothetical protein
MVSRPKTVHGTQYGLCVHFAQTPVPGGAEASIAFGTALLMTCDQPVDPWVWVWVFRVQVRVDCFIPKPIPMFIPTLFVCCAQCK